MAILIMYILGCPFSTHHYHPKIKNSLGQQNLIALHQTTKDFIVTHTAPFSIKFVITGAEYYQCDNKQLSVDATKYLIINSGQPYASFIDESKGTTSICIFFADEFLASAYQDCICSNEDQLSSTNSAVCDFHFYQKLYWKDEQMQLLLHQYEQIFGNELSNDQLQIDEWCHMLLTHIFKIHQLQKQQCNQLSGAKSSTRIEIFKRLSHSVDYINEYFSRKITLRDLASVACLSTFHYHRLFKEAFNCTPHEYLTSVRLKRAVSLFKDYNLSVCNVAMACGFENESAFIRRFKKDLGITPTAIRRSK